MFLRFSDDGLAQVSFLIGCDRTKQAVVIDPRRDVGIYTAAARQLGATLVAAIETHLHADFVSGARELAAVGARVITGPGAALGYEHHEVEDRERLDVGDVRLTFLHTPGHTPEHIAVLAEGSTEPVRLFTGDLLFVGGVGRPDLLGVEQTTALAKQLHASLARMLTLGDDVEVHPGHGAGSLCGAGIGREPSSTIGRERRQNPMLQYENEAAFVDAVVAGLPETPAYFARMKEINRAGPRLFNLAERGRAVPAIRPAAAAALAADGARLIDLRSPDDFASAHPYGAINLAFGPKVGFWGGWLLEPDDPTVLIAPEPSQAQEAAAQLMRVGLDRIEGYISGGFDAWRDAALPTATLNYISVTELRTALGSGRPPRVLDVRTVREWDSGHIEGALNVPLGDLPSRLVEIPRDEPIAVICEGGYRSSLAASLLAHEGLMDVVNVTGGMAAYRGVEVT